MAAKRSFELMSGSDETRPKRVRPAPAAPPLMLAGKRTRDLNEETETEFAARVKRLAISPRQDATVAAAAAADAAAVAKDSAYREANARLRECHFLREQRRCAAVQHAKRAAAVRKSHPESD